MKERNYFFSCAFFVFLTKIYAASPENAGCLGHEKSLALIEWLEIVLTEAKDNFPPCKEDVISTNRSECDGQMSLSYIELSKKLVTDLREIIPTCSKPDDEKYEKDDEDEKENEKKYEMEKGREKKVREEIEERLREEKEREKKEREEKEKEENEREEKGREEQERKEKEREEKEREEKEREEKGREEKEREEKERTENEKAEKEKAEKEREEKEREEKEREEKEREEKEREEKEREEKEREEKEREEKEREEKRREEKEREKKEREEKERVEKEREEKEREKKEREEKEREEKERVEKERQEKEREEKEREEKEKFGNCAEILDSGIRESGVNMIWPKDTFLTGNSLQVYCDMQTDMGGWTLIQRRGEFPFQVDFRKNWKSYEKGFGNISEEFWLGNENILALCQNGCELRIDLQDWNGARGYGHYDDFKLTGRNYRMSVSGFTGNIVGLLHYSNDIDFSTKDKGNTQMANYMKSGWWHVGGGYYVNLNGLYQPGQAGLETVHWYSWREYKNLAGVEMKVRPK